MKHLNIEVEDAVYDAAKEASRNAGMMLRTWVAMAILAQACRGRAKELKYEPVEDT